MRSVSRTDVLIAGAGLAGARAAEALRALGFDGRVLVVGDEPHAPYERPALSKAVLLGTREPAGLALRDEGFWSAREIELHTGAGVDSVDVRARRAVVGGRPLAWRRLVLATGLRPRRPRVFEGLSNVHCLRTLDDAEALRGGLVPGARLAVVGAGFIGLEVATAALRLGVDVVAIERSPAPFARSLGPLVGARMAGLARAAGVELRLAAAVAGVRREGSRLMGLELEGGGLVGCDLALVGVGSEPNAELVAGQLAIAQDGGVAVDAAGRTAATAVYACGDVASIAAGDGGPGRLEHWTVATATGRLVAHSIVGSPAPAPAPAYFWTDQFDSRLQVVGHPGPGLAVQLDESAGGFVARYRDAAGRVVAIALLDRPELLAQAREELPGGAAHRSPRGAAAA